MSRVKCTGWAACGALVLAACVACAGDDNGTGPSGDGTDPSPTGAILITAGTTGEDQDTDGYRVEVESDGRALGANGETVFSGLVPGDYDVELTGMAANCTVTAANPRTLSVVANETSETTFDVACTRLTGGLEVQIATAGQDLAPDGYTVDVDGETRTVGLEDAVTFTDVDPGARSVELIGVRANCTVDGDNPLTLIVAAGSVSTATFEVTCRDAVVNQIAFQTVRDGNTEIYVQDVDGPGVTNLTDDPAVDTNPVVSPDGTKILFASTRDDPDRDIYVMNADGSGVTRLTTTAGRDIPGAWSPDGSQIAFTSDRIGNFEVYVMNADASGPQVNLTNNDSLDASPDWSPDGSRIAFHTRRDGNLEVYVMDAANGSDPVNLTNNEASDQTPRWSPDGSKVVFTSFRDGNGEVYVMDVGDLIPVNLTNDAGGDGLATWSPDGTLIAFDTVRDGNFEIYIMSATDGTVVNNLTDNAAKDESPWWSRIR